ncbi:MAG: hypothetical protein EP318_12325 [Rhodobacteraceae bacterium]|nr:MAG: hypothetical protein EP318_12325 [Paracoccaceae bacterium]
MSVTSDPRPFRRLGALAALGCSLLLAACSSGGEGSDITKYVREFAAQKIGGSSAGGPQRITPQQIQQVAAKSKQPLVLIDFPEKKSNALIIEIARNGAVQTYATSARQTVALENGLARGSRGLGGDLMSADLGRLPHMIAQRRGGINHREMRFLNGEDITVRFHFSCKVEVGPTGGNPRTTTMTEDCTQINGLASFTNTYQVNGAGRVLKSEQWFGPSHGQAVIQQIRF